MTVLEVAEAFAHGAVKPKRSLLFVWHTAEEKGLLGSRYFADHPTVPRDSIVATDQHRHDGSRRTRGSRAGSERYLARDRLAATVDGARRSRRDGEQARADAVHASTTRSTRRASDNIYCRSDHYNYARYGIPVAFLTTGLHGDYHQVTDEPQYIDYAHLQRVGQFVFNLTKRVADLDHRPVVDKPKPDPNGNLRSVT